MISSQFNKLCLTQRFSKTKRVEGGLAARLRKLDCVLDTPVDNFGSDFFELFLAVLFCALGKFNKMM